MRTVINCNAYDNYSMLNIIGKYIPLSCRFHYTEDYGDIILSS